MTNLASTPSRRDRGIFDEDNAGQLAAADVEHWWFRGKAALLNQFLRRFDAPPGWLVDVGAGSGGVTRMLDWDHSRRGAVEGSATLATLAGRRGIKMAEGDVCAIPMRSSGASVVCLLDVIEHLPAPTQALAEARRVVAHDGLVVVTVPAHRWLWSSADVELGHYRRYSRQGLRDEMVSAGLAPIWVSHVFSWCVPPVWLARRARRGSAEPVLGISETPRAVTAAADVLNRLERRVLRRVQLPIGTSILGVARAT